MESLANKVADMRKTTGMRKQIDMFSLQTKVFKFYLTDYRIKLPYHPEDNHRLFPTWGLTVLELHRLKAAR